MHFPKVACEQRGTVPEQGWSQKEKMRRISIPGHGEACIFVHIAQWCHLRNSPEVQNIQRNTGGIDPISRNAIIGASKLYKYSLSKFQWWFWISQLPSRTSKNKRINSNNFEYRTALEGEGGNVGNSYIKTLQIGSVSKAFFFFLTAAFSCLSLFCGVQWVAITASCLSPCPLTSVLLAAVVPRIQWP